MFEEHGGEKGNESCFVPPTENEKIPNTSSSHRQNSLFFSSFWS